MDSTGLVAPEGRPFIAASFILLMIGLLFGFANWLNLILLVAFVFVTAFFRDPDRKCPGESNQVLCPADGLIVEIAHFEKDRFLDEPSVRISIFMSPFNVHVNRAPLDGTVEKIIYNPGRFLHAASEKASMDNEQSAMIQRLPDGRRIVTNQIAGFIARRIVVRIKEGAELKRGKRFGMIRFGSRVDVHLPPDTKLTCAKGERVFAGDTILGELAK